jgi:ABC-type nitrate/sulfonate/bicarbonate transport system substrate-binding protein
MLTRRDHVWQCRSRALLIALALILVGLRAPPAAGADLVAFKVGISDRVNTVLPLWMAEAGGFYGAQGLKVEIVTMGGGSRGAQELQAGHIDVMRVGLSSVVQTNRAGGDLRVIASMSNVIRFTFFSASGVKTAADLKGGVIGVSTFGSESDSTVTLALRRLGMTRDDVTLKEYGGAARRLAALKSGEIKASAINEPVASQARNQGINVMVDLVAEQIPWVFSSVVVRQGDLTSRRDLVTRFLKAAIEGNYLAFFDEKLAKDVLARELKVTDRKIVDISYDDFRKQSPLDMEPSRPGAENVIAELPDGVRTGLEDIIDPGILEDLKRQDFFTGLRRKYGIR